MKIIFIAFFCCLTSARTQAQNNFTIHGKIEMLSKAKNIVIAGPGHFSAPIKNDGTFEISGKVTEPGIALIFTDSSGANVIRIEPGEYTITCKEIVTPTAGTFNFRIPVFEGPRDANITHGFNEQLFYIHGESREESRKMNKEFCIHYLDSIFKNYPDSKALPQMVLSSLGRIGDEAALTYFSLLSTVQKNDSSTKQLEYYFNRKAKIEKEKFFEDFNIKTAGGKDFQLSSLTGKKLILIDFWASDCFPCRRKHGPMGELYSRLASKGLEIVSVSLDDSKKEWVKAIDKDKMTWINVSELKGWNGSLGEHYFIKVIPYSFLLDGNRKILGQNLSIEQIEAYLKE